MKSRSQESEALKSAAALLKIRDRSTAELTERLARKGCSSSIIQSTLRVLSDRGLLNDERTARLWVENAHRNGYGRDRVRQMLQTRGIAANVIDAVLSATDTEDEAERAWKSLRQRGARFARLPEQKRHARISDFLRRRGYSDDCIEDVVARYERGPIAAEEEPE